MISVNQIPEMQTRKPSTIVLFLLVLLGLSCAGTLYYVIQNFSGPITGTGDEEQWEYTGYYLQQNLRFTPFPHLDLNNNQTFYPYGTSHVFNPWGLERDYFYAFFSNFGRAAWLQLYYLLTVIGTAVGSCLLLRKEYGWLRSGLAGIIVVSFNFYMIFKYPGHLSYAVLHWTVFSLIVDFLIVKRVTFQKHVSLRLILLRLCLLVLCLSQELGYIAGYALMSFTVSSVYIALLLAYQQFKSPARLASRLSTLLQAYKSDYQASTAVCWLLLLVTGVGLYFYLPLVVQIASTAKQFDFSQVVKAAYWTSPYRLFLPYFPGFNPILLFQKGFGDLPEGLGDGSPGWFLLAIGTIGLWQTRKKLPIFVPLLVMLLLCIFYFPNTFPTLKIFPWFAFNRIPGRSTVIYPLIFTIFALELSFQPFKRHLRSLLIAVLVCIACVELSTSYGLRRSSYAAVQFDKSLFPYMEYVRQQPGEAVLDFPFCVTGGNGVGAINGLCPYYFINNPIHALRRFHHKKVVGQYFGRLHPSQIQPFLDAGWQNLLVPEKAEFLKATKLARCFNAQEWAFFTEFYLKNDFAGINLYSNLLPDQCAAEFYRRFGKPVIETRLPSGTQIEFIPKSQEQRKAVNLAIGKRVNLNGAK